MSQSPACERLPATGRAKPIRFRRVNIVVERRGLLSSPQMWRASRLNCLFGIPVEQNPEQIPSKSEPCHAFKNHRDNYILFVPLSAGGRRLGGGAGEIRNLCRY